MGKKHCGGPRPIPPGNKPHAGPLSRDVPDAAELTKAGGNAGVPFQDQDVKRRLGDYTTAGEHARQQHEAANDGDRHSK
jgi:hypothetical protein